MDVHVAGAALQALLDQAVEQRAAVVAEREALVVVHHEAVRHVQTEALAHAHRLLSVPNQKSVFFRFRNSSSPLSKVRKVPLRY